MAYDYSNYNYEEDPYAYGGFDVPVEQQPWQSGFSRPEGDYVGSRQDVTDQYTPPYQTPPRGGAQSYDGAEMQGESGSEQSGVPSIDQMVADLQKEYGTTADPSNIEALKSGRMTAEEYEARERRRGAPTASAGGRGGDADLNYDGKLDPGWTKGAGGQVTRTSGFDLSQLQKLGGQYTGPGGSGVFPGNQLQQVGQDPLSQLISGGYLSMLQNGGQSQLGQDIDSTLRGLISRQGAVDENPQAKAQRLEAARQPIDSLRKAHIDSAKGNLANRGLLSVPGIQQGAEVGTLGRIEEAIAPHYATAGQNLAVADLDLQDQRLTQALGLATGLSQAQSQSLLATLNSAGNRQQMLSEIALSTLDRNMAWNRFLAEFGLQRDSLFYAIEQGRVDSVMPILQMFIQYAGLLNRGYA